MISKIAVKRPVTMIMVLIAILVVGAMSMSQMPKSLMPNIDYPMAFVMVSYSGASPQEVDNQITTPIEAALASVENVKEMSSYSREGSSVVILQFKSGTDMDFATLNMREKVSMAQQALPKSASAPTVMKSNFNAMPVMQIYASSETMDESALATYLEDNVLPNFKRLQGVAAVEMSGGTKSQINLDFDQSKLQGYNLSMSTINELISSENISTPSGSVKNGVIKMTVRTDGRFKSVDDIKYMPITLSDGKVIMLQDVANITLSKEEPETITRLNGKTAIDLSISKSTDANIVDLSDSVLRQLYQIEARHGDKIHFEVGMDGAEFIRTSIKSVSRTAMQGAIFAILVIFIFLRNFRSTLVIGLSIPASMMATFWIMKSMGMTLNMMTLGALTICIGMVVDNSVVVLENIFRRNKQGLNSKDAAIEGSSEVILAVMASTLTSVVVYLPIAVSGGTVGMIFKDFCLTIIAVLSISLAVSVTIVPMLSSKLLDNSVSEDYVRIGKFFYRYRLVIYFTKLIESMQTGYVSVAKWMLKRRKRIVAFSIVIFISSIWLIGMIGSELMPSMDEGNFTINVDMPAGTKVQEKDAYMSNIEKYCMTIPEMKTVTLSTGSNSDLSMSSNGSVTVQLVDSEKRKRSTVEVMNDVKKEFSDLAGANITYEAGNSTAGSAIGGADMQIGIEGDDAEIVRNTLIDIKSYIKENAKYVDNIKTEVDSGTPEIVMKLNKSAAIQYGVNTSLLSNTLSNSLSGMDSTRVTINGENITLKLKMNDEYGNSIENMKSIIINTPAGKQVPVGQVAEISYDNGPATIMKENQKVQSSVDITFNENIDIKKGTSEIDTLMNNYIMPSGVSLNTGGTTSEIDETFKNLTMALFLSILLVYIVLASQFESFILPVMIMMSIPFAFSGSFLALFLTGTKLSMVSLIAFIMLMGMVVNNAILLIEFINQNKENMDRDEAIARAGSVRLRPILMTTLTTILGMMPMAIGAGEASKTMAPMAIAMIGGMTASTIITLFLVPVLYAIVDDKEKKLGIKRRSKKRLRLYEEALWLAKNAGKLEEKRLRKEAKKKIRNI